MTGAVPVAIVLGNGAGVPGAYVAVGITLLLFSVGYATMSQHVTNTGAFFAYVGRGLGVTARRRQRLRLARRLHRRPAGDLRLLRRRHVGRDGRHSSASASPGIWWSLIAWALVTGALAAQRRRRRQGPRRPHAARDHSPCSSWRSPCSSEGGPDGVDFAASFAPSNVFVGGLAGSAGHRAGVRLRLLHRLRGDRDLRRGVQGPQAHRADRDLRGGHR